jgi:hypothetical protein
MPKITELPEATSVNSTDLMLLTDISTNPPTAKSVEAGYIADIAPVSAVATKVGAILLDIADINNLTATLDDLLPADNYAQFAWATRTVTGTLNNYLVSPATMLRVNVVGSVVITGFSGGTTHAWHRIINVSQTNLTIAHQSTQSSPQNRVILPTAAPLIIYPNHDAIFFYDPIVQRWRSPGCPYTPTI